MSPEKEKNGPKSRARASGLSLEAYRQSNLQAKAKRTKAHTGESKTTE